MKIAKTIAFLGALAMGSVLTYAFVMGDLAGEGRELLSLPWGIVSLVDVYVGFALFCGWIVYREKSRVWAALWVLSVMVLGNLTASVYALLALWSSKGDWKRFWMGSRASD